MSVAATVRVLSFILFYTFLINTRKAEVRKCDCKGLRGQYGNGS